MFRPCLDHFQLLLYWSMFRSAEHSMAFAALIDMQTVTFNILLIDMIFVLLFILVSLIDDIIIFLRVLFL